MRLTDLSIKALRVPTSGVILYSDDILTGFGVRVSQAGTKSYVLTHGPRRERETLGRVGMISLQEARAEAKRRLAEYTLGKNKPQAIAWDTAKEEFLEEKARKLKPRTLADYRYELNKHFKYGQTRLTELLPHDLYKSLGRMSNTPAEQRHAFVVLRAFMHWAYRKNYLDRNPMERMQTPYPYIPRERVLTDDELRRVWLAAGDDTFGRIVKMLILTGQRRGEITVLTGSMVNTDTITLPSWLAKNKREHTFPLGNIARATLNPLVAPNAYFFPAHGRKTPFNGHSPCKRKLDARSGVTGWTLHDLRRTFASGLAAQGVSLPVIERFLNHVSGSFGGIVGVYQRYDFMPEMREAVSLWENHIEKLVGASPLDPDT
jgi:integrase